MWAALLTPSWGEPTFSDKDEETGTSSSQSAATATAAKPVGSSGTAKLGIYTAVVTKCLEGGVSFTQYTSPWEQMVENGIVNPHLHEEGWGADFLNGGGGGGSAGVGSDGGNSTGDYSSKLLE